MNTTQSLRIEVVQPDGRELRLEVDAAVAQVGRGAHCEVQLADPKVLPTHLELAAREGVVFARATLAEALLWVDGRPSSGGALPAGAALRVGDTALRVSLRDNGPRLLRLRRARRGAVVGLVLLLSSVAAARLWSAEAPDTASRLEARAWPELVAPRGPLACPEHEPERALALARSAEQAARLLRERTPFLPGDGLRAVASLEQAAACFERAGRGAATEGARALGAAARDARAQAAALEARALQRYRAHRVGLGWALRNDDPAALRRHASVLLALTRASSAATDPLVEWLSQLSRRAEQSAAASAHRG